MYKPQLFATESKSSKIKKEDQFSFQQKVGTNYGSPDGQRKLPLVMTIIADEHLPRLFVLFPDGLLRVSWCFCEGRVQIDEALLEVTHFQF